MDYSAYGITQTDSKVGIKKLEKIEEFRGIYLKTMPLMREQLANHKITLPYGYGTTENRNHDELSLAYALIKDINEDNVPTEIKTTFNDFYSMFKGMVKEFGRTAVETIVRDIQTSENIDNVVLRAVIELRRPTLGELIPLINNYLKPLESIRDMFREIPRGKIEESLKHLVDVGYLSRKFLPLESRFKMDPVYEYIATGFGRDYMKDPSDKPKNVLDALSHLGMVEKKLLPEEIEIPRA